MRKGRVYTETTIYAAPREFVAEAPYQLIIVTLDEDGTRMTGRVVGDPVHIEDLVELVEERAGVPFFRNAYPQPNPEPNPEANR
ncbi:MAG: OB-fold domain-containing protein [Bryobacteraceae bacterium]|nr:OB-fold domain-containing protein [Bryobacteraceae bacterium]